MIFREIGRCARSSRNGRNMFTNIFSNKSSNRIDTGKYQIVSPGKLSPSQPIPMYIDKPPYFYQFMAPETFRMSKPEIKLNNAIEGVRKSSRIAANILEKCETILKPGLTTDEIDQFVHSECIKVNAYPSPLNYSDFPKSVCTSVNNVAVHGIPDDRPLVDGDIINVDITVYFEGYHGDCSKTFLIGNVDELGQHLVRVTEECLYKAIEICGPNVPYSEIGHVIEEHAEKNNLSIIREFVGHGIGSYFHGKPDICHYKNDFEGKMMSNTTFTIEPVLCLGNPAYKCLSDEWTVVTKDKSRTAQFEHTILITKTGCEILTLPESFHEQNDIDETANEKLN